MMQAKADMCIYIYMYVYVYMYIYKILGNVFLKLVSCNILSIQLLSLLIGCDLFFIFLFLFYFCLF